MEALPLQQHQTSRNIASHATARTEDALYTTSHGTLFASDDINPRARKRRRADSAASSNDSIAAADHQELVELYPHLASAAPTSSGIAAVRSTLPYNAGLSLGSLHALDTGVRAARDAIDERSRIDITDIYQLAHEKMIASVQRPSPTTPKFQTPTEYGPYHAQYWSLVENNLDAETPLATNGGYQSPYGSLAQEVFFSGVTADHGSPQHHQQYNGVTSSSSLPSISAIGGSMSHQSGYDHPNGSAYSLGRHTPQYANCMPPEAANVYPSPVDNFNWIQFPSPLDSSHSASSLESLSSQMLDTIQSLSVDELLSALTNQTSSNGQALANLESLMTQTASSFPREQSGPFIDVNQVQMTSLSSLTAVRKANLAILSLTLFRGRNIPFSEINHCFLDIFMPPGLCLQKQGGSLFLELKTQAYIAIMLSSNLRKEEVIDQLFPRDLQLTILRRRAEPPHLAASEQDFISRLNSRRHYLLSSSDDIDALSQLRHKYPWKDFLAELWSCIGHSLEQLDRAKMASTPSVSRTDDPIGRAALVAHAAISNQGPSSLNPYASPTSIVHSSPFDNNKRKRSSSISEASLSPPSPNNGAHFQYGTARPHSAPKPQSPFVSALRRMPNATSTRRPWTPEEEKALLDGLERVKGPHWSQILALYGVGGSISDILKERNQVQLKDKARNLKLFFLKSGLVVPFFLQKVTGELKTRAPAQAAKLEAKERQRRLEEQKMAGRGLVGMEVK